MVHFCGGGAEGWCTFEVEGLLFDTIFGLRVMRGSFIPNFRLLTQLVKFLEFHHSDMNFIFSTFSKKKIIM